MKDVLIFGVQGSGKGTQAQIIADKYKGTILGTGDMFRNIADKETELAKQIRAHIDRGEVVTDDLVDPLVHERYAELREQGKFIIFDGFPRTLKQVVIFTRLMAKFGRDYHAVYLHLTKAEGLARVQKRFQTEGRADDSEASIIEKRMDTFFRDTLPVVHYFETQGKLTHIDGSLSIGEVTEQIDKSLGALLT